jgi:hypothetical protein
MWRTKNKSKKDQPVECRDQEAMNKICGEQIFVLGLELHQRSHKGCGNDAKEN